MDGRNRFYISDACIFLKRLIQGSSAKFFFEVIHSEKSLKLLDSKGSHLNNLYSIKNYLINSQKMLFIIKNMQMQFRTLIPCNLDKVNINIWQRTYASYQPFLIKHSRYKAGKGLRLHIPIFSKLI